MTNPTPPGQVPDALPAIQRFEVVDCIDSKHVPAVIPKPHGPWVRYEDHAAALCRLHAENEALRAQQDDAYDHGPQAETVEEAARDVGKWLNERPDRPLDLRHVAMLTHHAKRTQQPAPAGAMATWAAVQEHYETLADFQEGQWWVNELDAMASHPIGQTIRVTPDMLRAVAVVHNLLRAAATPQPAPAGATDTKTLELLSTTVGLLMGYREGGARQPYKPGSVVAKVVDEVVDHLKDWPTPQPSPTAQAASSAVLKAIREANMQLVRTGDNAFMLVPHKVATAQAAGSVPAISDLPPLPDPDLRDVGTKPQDVKDFLNGYATEYARLALAARAPAESVGRDAALLDWLDQQREAYGFQDIHEGNRWEISGAYANVREAIDAERAARKQGGAT